MANINVLKPQIANQIAAGEVVERPCAIIKELVENSFDANATKVIVEIEQGGIKKILIRDNGDGIEKDDLPLALKRHATSKISKIEDLDTLLSMGFRGEALASIAAVSRLVLTSKPKEQDNAFSVMVEGIEQTVQVIPASHPNGTSIEVADLFFNTPARKRFLKSEKTEYLKCEETFKRLALSRPNIALTLKHNGKVIYDLKPALNDEDLRKRLKQIMGSNFAQNALSINEQNLNLSLNGFLQIDVKGKDNQYFFVNKRIVKDKLIYSSIKNVLKNENLPEDCAYVLFLELDPSDVDINVHPQKFEVRFSRSREVYDFIYGVILHAIRNDSQVLPESYEETINPDLDHNYLPYKEIKINEDARDDFLNSVDNNIFISNEINNDSEDSFNVREPINSNLNFNIKPASLNLNTNQQNLKENNIYNKIFSKGSTSRGSFNNYQNEPKGIFGKGANFKGEEYCLNINSNNENQPLKLSDNQNLNQVSTNNTSSNPNVNNSLVLSDNSQNFSDILSNDNKSLSLLDGILPWNEVNNFVSSIYKVISVEQLNYAVIFGGASYRVVDLKKLAQVLFKQNFYNAFEQNPEIFKSSDLLAPISIEYNQDVNMLDTLLLDVGFKLSISKNKIIIEAVPTILRNSDITKIFNGFLAKFNQDLGLTQIRDIFIDELFKVNIPYYFNYSMAQIMISQINCLAFWNDNKDISILIPIEELIKEGFKNE